MAREDYLAALAESFGRIQKRAGAGLLAGQELSREREDLRTAEEWDAEERRQIDLEEIAQEKRFRDEELGIYAPEIPKVTKPLKQTEASLIQVRKMRNLIVKEKSVEKAIKDIEDKYGTKFPLRERIRQPDATTTEHIDWETVVDLKGELRKKRKEIDMLGRRALTQRGEEEIRPPGTVQEGINPKTGKMEYYDEDGNQIK